MADSLGPRPSLLRIAPPAAARAAHRHHRRAQLGCRGSMTCARNARGARPGTADLLSLSKEKAVAAFYASVIETSWPPSVELTLAARARRRSAAAEPRLISAMPCMCQCPSRSKTMKGLQRHGESKEPYARGSPQPRIGSVSCSARESWRRLAVARWHPAGAESAYGASALRGAPQRPSDCDLGWRL